MINIHKHVGLAGVDENESTSARRLGKFFEVCAILIIYIIALQWEMHRKGIESPDLEYILNWAVFGFFLLEFFILVFAVKDKIRYLLQNWMIIIIIFGGIALLINYAPLTDILKNLRLLLVAYLLIPFLDRVFRSLSDNRLGTTLITAILFMILAGIIIAGIDPAIPSPVEGIWWAWVTMSTVGFGDYVPVSTLGRVFAALLILMGLGLFSIITANFSAIFIQREVREGVKEVKRESEEVRLVLKNIQAVRHEEEHIENMLHRINDRLDDIEGKLK